MLEKETFEETIEELWKAEKSVPYFRILAFSLLGIIIGWLTWYLWFSPQHHLNVASEELHTGNLNSAIEKLDALYKDDPTNLQTVLLLASAYRKTHNYRLSKFLYSRALSIEPENNNSRLALSESLVRLGEYAQAEKYLLIYTKKNPDQYMGRLLLGETRYGLGKKNEGLVLVKHVIPIAPEKAQTWLTYGSLLIAEKRMAEAIKILNKARSLAPANFVVLQRLAQAHTINSDPKQAEKVYDDILHLKPATEWAWIEKARLKENPDDTESTLKQGLRIIPDSISIRLQLTMLYNQTEQSEKAAKQIQLLLAKNPNQPDALFFQAEFEMDRDSHSTASHILQKVVRLQPKHFNAWVNLARLQMHAGKSHATATSLIKALKLQPENLDVRLMLVEAIMAQNKHEQALSLIRPMINQHPNDRRIKLALAKALKGSLEIRFTTTDAAEARKLYNQLAEQGYPAQPELDRIDELEGREPPNKAVLQARLEKRPGDVYALNRIIQHHLEQRTFDQAEAMLQKEAITRHFPQQIIKPLQAQIKLSQGNFSAAESLAQKSIEIDKNAYAAYLILAEAIAHQGRVEEAIERYRASMKLFDTPMTTMAIGILEQTQGHYQAAGEMYAKVLEKDINIFPAANNFAWLLLENLHHQPIRAVQLSNRAYYSDRSNGAYADTYGWALVHHREYKDAIPVLREAVRLTGNHPTVRFHLSMALYAADQQDEAVEILLELQKLDDLAEKNRLALFFEQKDREGINPTDLIMKMLRPISDIQPKT